MHIEGFNLHALEGAINIARSISFVAVAAICIDNTNIFLTSPAICIVLTIRWSMSNAIHIAVCNIATMCPSMHITPINTSGDHCVIHIVYSICCPIVGAIHIDYNNMIVFNTFNTYCHIRCIALDNTYWIAFFKLLWFRAVTPIGRQGMLRVSVGVYQYFT